MSNSPTIRGLKGLATFLQTEKSQLRRTPIILVTSEADKLSRPAVAEAIRQVQFMLAQRFGFRMAPMTVKSSIPDDASSHTMVNRLGAKTAVAVGSGNAMDVAKTLPIKRLLYVPATYGASLVASAQGALHVDAQGEIGVDVNTNSEPTKQIHRVLLEEAYFDTENHQIPLAAGMALLHDHGGALPASLPTTHDERYEFMSHVGAKILSYGLKNTPRSKPLAIATALQATIFRKYSLMEIMASLLPAYDDSVMENMPQFLTTEPWDTMVASLRENRATWNCIDAPDEDFRTLLSKKHLL